MQVVDADAAVLIRALKADKAYRRAVSLSQVGDTNPRLQDLGKQQVSLARDAREHLPRADVSYQFKSAAGTVKVHITSAGETFKLEITSGRNPMAAQLACIELEKQLTFMALTG